MKKYRVELNILHNGEKMPCAFEVFAKSAYAAEWKVVDLFREDVKADGDGWETVKVEEV
jgi:hypothetical protein